MSSRSVGPGHLGRPPCGVKLCSDSGRAVSQEDAPFSWASSTALLRLGGSCSVRVAASCSLDFPFSLLIVILASICFARMLYPYSLSWDRMWSWRAEVTISDECSSLPALRDGMSIPRPPNLAGSANSVHSRSLRGGLPVSWGGSVDHSNSSSSFSLWAMLGTVRLRYVHLLRRP